MVSWRAHLLILLAVLALPGILSVVVRRRPESSRIVRLCLVIVLAANELLWYGYQFHAGGFRFPEGLPLQLCDLTLWLTVVAALTLWPGVFEVAYFCGLAGAGMALVTPDLWAPFPSYPTVYFFLSHGLVVATLLTLAAGGLIRLRRGCVWRALAALNAYAVLVGGFDLVFKTNYMYLCQKPAAVSLLSYFGPWPVYILGAEGFAVLLFYLLWLPLRRGE